MHTLVLFYLLTGKFHTDVASITTQFQSEELCKAGAPQVIVTLKKAYPSVGDIEWSCIKSGN